MNIHVYNYIPHTYYTRNSAAIPLDYSDNVKANEDSLTIHVIIFFQTNQLPYYIITTSTTPHHRRTTRHENTALCVAPNTV